MRFSGHYDGEKKVKTFFAEKESAQLRADAISIVGQAAKDFPEYRHQEFMGAFAEALQNDSIDKIIFVPTECNVPIVQTRNDSVCDP